MLIVGFFKVFVENGLLVEFESACISLLKICSSDESDDNDEADEADVIKDDDEYD